MKTINSRKLVVLGGILAATLAAGCFDSGGGYYGDPNGGYYNSSPYYGSSRTYYPNNSGRNIEHEYPQRYSNSYGAGYHDGVRADTSRDHQQERNSDHQAAVVRDRDQTRTEKVPTSVAREDNSRKEDSQSGHRSEGN
jgi:hypothetical protein